MAGGDVSAHRVRLDKGLVQEHSCIQGDIPGSAGDDDGQKTFPT